MTGTAKGVAFSTDGRFAVVATGGGLSMVSLEPFAAPSEVGTASIGGDARDVVIRGNFALVADFNSSLTIVEIGDPENPIFRSSTPLNTGGRLNDVAVRETLAFGADVLFVNEVPIVEVSVPNAPVGAGTIDFSGFRDDNGHGIAVDANFIYLAANLDAFTENGVSGNSLLYIGQYLAQEDLAGIPPTATILAPGDGDEVIEGQTVTVRADAGDDVAVAAVDLLVDGEPVKTGSTIPFETQIVVPLDVASLSLQLRAIDLGGNVGLSPLVTLRVLPDPGTTVIGVVVDPDGVVVEGATVTTSGDRSSVTDADGAFSIFDVPTAQGRIVARASATIGGRSLVGRSIAVPPVPEGITDVGVIQLGRRIALVNSDGGSRLSVKDELVATGFFEADDITLINAGASTPPLAQLLEFDALLVWSNFPFANPDAIGNVLADYVDQGGGVVLATYVYSRPWRIGGRIISGGLSPFQVPVSRFTTSGTLDLAGSDSNHPILAGVNSASYFVNGNYTNPPLTPGATLVARDTGGNRLIAVKPDESVVGISIYPGFLRSSGTGDVTLIFANALNFVR